MEDLEGAIDALGSDGISSGAYEAPRLHDISGGNQSIVADFDDEEDLIWRAGRLIEVFSVRFINYEQLDLDGIYGAMLLNFYRTKYIFFERFPGDPLPIDSQGSVKMAAPRINLQAMDGVEFHAFLFDLDGHADDSSGLLWGNEDVNLCLFNQLLSRRWYCSFGPIEINFAVYINPAEALLDVTLMDCKGNGTFDWNNLDHTAEAEVFGTIFARNNMIGGDKANEAKSCMFDRKREMCAPVRPGEAIPLSKRTVALPFRSRLVVYVSLCRRSTISEHDALIVQDKAKFVAAFRGYGEQILSGPWGSIKVKVTWLFLGKLLEPLG